jgi:hypothetical protein
MSSKAVTKSYIIWVQNSSQTWARWRSEPPICRILVAAASRLLGGSRSCYMCPRAVLHAVSAGEVRCCRPARVAICVLFRHPPRKTCGAGKIADATQARRRLRRTSALRVALERRVASFAVTDLGAPGGLADPGGSSDDDEDEPDDDRRGNGDEGAVGQELAKEGVAVDALGVGEDECAVGREGADVDDGR